MRWPNRSGRTAQAEPSAENLNGSCELDGVVDEACAAIFEVWVCSSDGVHRGFEPFAVHHRIGECSACFKGIEIDHVLNSVHVATSERTHEARVSRSKAFVDWCGSFRTCDDSFKSCRCAFPCGDCCDKHVFPLYVPVLIHSILRATREVRR